MNGRESTQIKRRNQLREDPRRGQGEAAGREH